MGGRFTVVHFVRNPTCCPNGLVCVLFSGQASSAKAQAVGNLAKRMADVGWTFASKEGFRLFNAINPDPLATGAQISSSGPTDKS